MPEEAPKKRTYTKWVKSGTKFYPRADSTEQLTVDAGFYDAYYSPIGPMLNPIPLKTDNLLELEDSPVANAFAGIRKFWESKQKFVDFGLVHKRGILFHGVPGGGKSAAVLLLVNELVKANGVVMRMDTDYFHEIRALCRALREIEPDRALTVLIEDLDIFAMTKDRQTGMPMVTALLSFLDGEDQVGNIVTLATTNYLERLDARLLNRPSRFDEIVNIGLPSIAMRRSYLKQVCPTLSIKQLEDLAFRSDGLMVAHLRELVIATQVLGMNVDATLMRLKQMTVNQLEADKQRTAKVVSPAVQRMFEAAAEKFGL